MEKNLGQFDRIIRVVVGVALIVISLTLLSGILKFVLLVLGIIFLITSAIGSCCLYKPLGINTKGKNKEE